MEERFDLWLAALSDEVLPASEMHSYWAVRDDPTPILDAALDSADYLYVGYWSATHESQEPQDGKCPARRVFDWLFWRGTADGFGVPVLDEQLTGELLSCFEPQPTDLAAPAADIDDVRAFLGAHRGCGILSEERGPGR